MLHFLCLIILLVTCLIHLLQGCHLPLGSSNNTCPNSMCGMLLWGRTCSKAFFDSHCLEMCIFLPNLAKLRVTFLESHLHLLLIISISLLEMLYLNKLQTCISYAEPLVWCCLHVRWLLLIEGTAWYRDTAELLQNWFIALLIAANLFFSWHTLAGMTQRKWTEIPDPGDLFALSCDSVLHY